jgi:L-lactate dehydrogenase complex protein LldE
MTMVDEAPGPPRARASRSSPPASNDTMFPADAQGRRGACWSGWAARWSSRPRQTCCGQMFTNTGYFDEAVPSCATTSSVPGLRRTSWARRVVRRLGPAPAPDARPTPATPGWPGRSAEVAPRTYDSQRIPRRRAGRSPTSGRTSRTGHLPPDLPLAAGRAGGGPAHAPAAGRRGHRLVSSPDADECCGFGGTFAMKNPDVSSPWPATRPGTSPRPAPRYLVAGDNSCLLNIGGILSAERRGPPIHLVEILASTEAEIHEHAESDPTGGPRRMSIRPRASGRPKTPAPPAPRAS